MRGKELSRLTTGHRSFHHFWPRLWSTARPLGGEARKAKSSCVLPAKESPLDDLDSRIFVQGGDWILNHIGILTTKDVASAAATETCVMLLRGSQLFKKVCPPSSLPQLIQGVLKSVSGDRLECELEFASCGEEEKGASNHELDIDFINFLEGREAPQDPRNVVKTSLTSEDIWWCLPYWVAANYNLHFEKIPVECGFYFLVEAGQAFCIVVLIWSDTKFFLKAKVDGKKCFKSRWLSEGRADGADNWPNLFHMFETGEEDGVMKGKQLTFTKREASEAPGKGWQEELSVSGAATVGIYQCIEVDESGSEVESDVEEEEEDSVKRKEEDEENVATSSNKERAKTRKPRTTKGAAVKKDSKWALHLSIAPAGGKVVENHGVNADERAGRVLGCSSMHYRGPEWFGTIDLMLQEERMRLERLQRNAGIIVGESTPEGATKDQAICLDDPPLTPQPPAAKLRQAQTGPVRNSKTFRVNFHEDGRGTPATHVVQVPKTHSVATFKSMVKDALADEDVVGEEIRSARLKWTYAENDSDKCEVDISPFTEMVDLEKSSALHVYAILKKV